MKKLLKKLFPDFTFTKDKSGSYFGTITVNQIEKRIIGDRHFFGNVYIFISGDMYPGTKDNFVYAMCWQKTGVIPYRSRTRYDVEFEKVFVSGKTTEQAIKKLAKDVDMNKYYLNTPTYNYNKLLYTAV